MNIENQNIILPGHSISALTSKNHVWHLFVVRVANRESFVNYLHGQGVGTLIHYPVPPNKQEGYPGLRRFKLPLTEKIHNEVVSLPLSPVMNNKEVEVVTEAVNSYK